MSSVTETSTSALGKQGEMLGASAAPAKGLPKPLLVAHTRCRPNGNMSTQSYY